MADSKSTLYLVPTVPPNLNPEDIALEALSIARECAAAMLFPRTPVLVLWSRALELQEPKVGRS